MNVKNVWVVIVLLCVFGLVAQAEVIVTTADGNGADCYLANDSQQDPTTVTGGEERIRAFRNLVDTRSKTGFIRFDLDGVAGDPNSAFMTFALTWQKGGLKTVDVYGLVDGAGDYWDEGSTNYNNAPGVLPTTLGNILLDENQTEWLGVLQTPAAAEPNQFSTNPIDLPLEDFLSRDTNGSATLIFVGGDNENEIASKERTDGLIPPTLTLPKASAVNRASDPIPANLVKVLVDQYETLSWTNPDPNTVEGVITCDVYFGDTEPNALLPNYGLDLLEAGISGTEVNMPDLDVYKTYYWCVDTYDTSRPSGQELVEGKVWSFNTNNSAPDVDAGPDQYIWLTKTVVITGSDADTYMREGEARGSVEFMDVRGGGVDFVGYLRFDLSDLTDLGPGAVQGATLTMRKVAASRNDTIVNSRFSLHGLNNVAGNTSQSWNEATLEDDGADPPGQEWNDVVPMTAEITNGWITDLDDDVAGITESIVGDDINISGTAFEAFLDGRIDDNGLVTFIIGCEDGNDRGYGIASKENATPEYRPVLQLTYVLEGATGTGDAVTSLNGSATDDGLPSGTIDLLWTQISGPENVLIDPNNILDPNVSMGTSGYYEFQLEADDGDLSASDTVQIYVGINPCDAAQADTANYVPIVADFNSDCFVDMDDLYEFSVLWLTCNALECP